MKEDLSLVVLVVLVLIGLMLLRKMVSLTQHWRRICFYEAVKSHKSLLRYKVGASNSSS